MAIHRSANCGNGRSAPATNPHVKIVIVKLERSCKHPIIAARIHFRTREVIMAEITAINWTELNEALFADTWNPTIKRFRSNFAYRGVNRSSYPIANGLSRLGKPYNNMEKNLIKQFKKYAHTLVIEKHSEWHWLSIAQHYGLPTRPIDWTYSPYVALHFATNVIEDFDKDGAVWKVNFAEVHTLLQDK